MKPLARRIQQMAPSMTVAIDTRAKQLKAAGADVLAMAAGEPDLATPQMIIDAAHQSMVAGKTRYTAPDGIPELKAAVCRKLQRENGLQYDPSQIVISSGAKQCISSALQVLIEDGDEVLVPTPCWVTYPELVRFCGGVPVMVPCHPESGFHLDIPALEAAITPRTKAILLNSPCNPTGAVYHRQELSALAQLIVRHDLWCISDEIYEHMVYGVPHIPIASLSQEAKDRCILVNGVSKSYAMTGWRIGYSASPQPVASAIAKLQGQLSHHPANASQYGAVCALDDCSAFVQSMRQDLQQRRNTVMAALNKISVLGQVPIPEGAFYVFPDVSGWYGRKTPEGKTIAGSVDLCAWLLDSQLLAIVPGAAFGEDRCVRLTYTIAPDNIPEAMRRFAAGLAALS